MHRVQTSDADHSRKDWCIVPLKKVEYGASWDLIFTKLKTIFYLPKGDDSFVPDRDHSSACAFLGGFCCGRPEGSRK